MKKHIPNIITCMNLISGCFAIVFAFKGMLTVASLLILLAALFDFFDGFFARLLHVQSTIGVDLDSLADMCSFAIAPTMILYVWMQKAWLHQPPYLQDAPAQYLIYLIFLIPALSAVRLAIFNHDERQHTSFVGLPTPANALFIGFLHLASDHLSLVNNFWVLLALSLIFALLLVVNIPLFSLKFTNFHFKDNIIRYIFLIISFVLLIILHLGAFPIIILCYLLLSLVEMAIKKIY